jgi:hypothetical protein
MKIAKKHKNKYGKSGRRRAVGGGTKEDREQKGSITGLFKLFKEWEENKDEQDDDEEDLGF